MSMKRVLAAAMMLCAAVSAKAEVQSGKIQGYVPYFANGKQIILFNIEGNVSGGCNVTGRFAIDSSSEYFKLNFAGILAAFHDQTPISVQYAPSCNSYPNAYDALIICFGKAVC